MASYYIVENNQQAGPFTVDQLAERGISADTSVWTDGMTSWVPASQVYELQSIIRQQQPTYPSKQAYSGSYQNSGSSYNDYRPCPKTWMVESILVMLFCCMPFGIVGIINASKVSSAHAVGNYRLADQASRDAGKWTKLGFFCGLAVNLLLILFYVIYFVFIMAAVSSGY